MNHPRFTLQRLMLAVAFVALICWATLHFPPEGQILVLLVLAPLLGAYREWRSVRPSQDAAETDFPWTRGANADGRLGKIVRGGITASFFAWVFANIAIITHFLRRFAIGYLDMLSLEKTIIDLVETSALILFLSVIFGAIVGSTFGIVFPVVEQAAKSIRKRFRRPTRNERPFGEMCDGQEERLGQSPRR
jgi:hypothetical protein